MDKPKKRTISRWCAVPSCTYNSDQGEACTHFEESEDKENQVTLLEGNIIDYVTDAAIITTGSSSMELHNIAEPTVLIEPTEEPPTKVRILSNIHMKVADTVADNNPLDAQSLLCSDSVLAAERRIETHSGTVGIQTQKQISAYSPRKAKLRKRRSRLNVLKLQKILKMLPSCIRRLNNNGFNKLAALFQANYSTETASFETKPFRLHKLDEGPSTHVTLTKGDALDMFTKLQTIRRMETSAGNLYKEKIVRGFCHLYSGQEAVCVGIKAALRPNDSVITAYRAHGWTYMMGMSILGVLSELTGRQSGCARGKGGSMHMYTDTFYGGNGIVGAQIPLGVGIAFAAQYQGFDAVCVALYGDGAANQGQVFEVYNMAKLLNIPCIFVCENNGYGMGTSAERASANTAYYTRGDYIPGIWIDGMDVLAVREAARYAVNHCSSGKGPILLEAATYRYSGHSMSDPGTSYRTRDEIQEVRQTRDPITSFKEKILTANLVTAEELKKIETEVRAQVDEATKKAKADQEIPLDELASDIYATNLEGKIRGMSSTEWMEHKRIGPANNLN
ncbi:pyruvate dehydrogenase e1 component alpha subunit bacterial and organellar [Holotrichia oblita]|uniref:Pyruvate dehydrogenase e1 component alpha subunit bacterial and organellar n=1 Tax=Holotrichia oblita TaxID=644536 RepID=A0ACB9SP94_HOLOL|nr:pyruvate dehydrogenase e1 component alpha subunit bacterial and organellar [Holotrichia oblita]